MSNQIRVGLIGAPHAGKSLTAEKLVDLWPETLSLIPNQGRVIRTVYDQAVGPFGTYREDLWTFFRLLDREVGCTKNDFISVGTGLESLIHAIVNLNSLTTGIFTPDTEREAQQRFATVAVMTGLFLENWNYNYIYYLPLKPNHDGLVDSFDFSFATQIEIAMEAFLDQFGYLHRVKRLTGTPEENAQMIYDEVFPGEADTLEPDVA